jgi:hypothetical protein
MWHSNFQLLAILPHACKLDTLAALLDAESLDVVHSRDFKLKFDKHCVRSVALKTCMLAVCESSSVLVCDEMLERPYEVPLVKPVCAMTYCHQHFYIGAASSAVVQKLSRQQDQWQVVSICNVTRSALVQLMAVSPNQQNLIISLTDRSLRLVSTQSLTVLKLVTSEHKLSCIGVYSPDYFVTGGMEGFLQVWNGDKCIETRRVHKGRVTQICVHASQSLCASACLSGKVILWETQSWQPIWSIEMGDSHCLSLAFNSSRSLLYVVTNARRFFTMDINTAHVMTTFHYSLNLTKLVHFGKNILCENLKLGNSGLHSCLIQMYS